MVVTQVGTELKKKADLSARLVSFVLKISMLNRQIESASAVALCVTKTAQARIEGKENVPVMYTGAGL
jgi:hypothetical protein